MASESWCWWRRISEYRTPLPRKRGVVEAQSKGPRGCQMLTALGFIRVAVENLLRRHFLVTGQQSFRAGHDLSLFHRIR